MTNRYQWYELCIVTLQFFAVMNPAIVFLYGYIVPSVWECIAQALLEEHLLDAYTPRLTRLRGPGSGHMQLVKECLCTVLSGHRGAVLIAPVHC